MVNPNPISSTIPLDQDGAHHGFLRLPNSRDDSAWGSVMIPITVIRNGEGPTALLTGGNHGDEYEGPVALMNLAASLNPAEITGRVIIVPTFNYPAFRAGIPDLAHRQRELEPHVPRRPGRDGDPKDRRLLPADPRPNGRYRAGLPFRWQNARLSSLRCNPCAAAMQAHNAPYSMRMLEIDNVGMFDTAVEDGGKVFVSTELGGGGTATARLICIAKKGARNLLIHAGILAGDPEMSPTVYLDMPDGNCFHFAETDGLIEPMADLGDTVETGQAVARIWPPDRTGATPAHITARRSGLLTARHFPGLVKVGDCVAVIAVVAERMV